MPGGVECNQNHEKQESVTDDANKNASPSFVHSFSSSSKEVGTRLLPIGRRRFLFCRDSIDFSFESRACMKDHDSACGNHDLLACFWISSRAGLLTSHGERAKAGDREGFSLLQGGLEEFKKSIQQRGCLWFRDPGFLMDAVSDVLLLHRTLVHRRPWDFSVNDAPTIGDFVKIGRRFRREFVFS
jgi:hypothetical protein